MRRILLIGAMLAMAAPALAGVTITATHTGNGVVEVNYVADGNDVRAFAFDVNVGGGQTIDSISDFNTGESTAPGGGYGIFPGKFRDYLSQSVGDGGPNWVDPNYNPVAPSGDPGAAGDLGTDAITVELGSLYVDSNAPGASGTLFKLQVSGSCTLAMSVNTIRGGMVDEDGGQIVPTFVGTAVTIGPACWQYITQCHADADGDCDVDTGDFPAFRDSFLKTYPDAAYNPCADYNRDGTVNTSDFPEFRDNFLKTCATGLAQDCTPGGTWPPL
jgi:hypothetical protein